MMELLSITFFSGMMGIFIILLLLMGALLLIGKNPFKGFSLTALVTTKPLAAKLQPYGGASGWDYRPFAQKGKTIVGRKGREKQTGKPIGLGAQIIESVRTIKRYRDTKGNKERSSFFKNIINNAPNKAKELNNLKRSQEINRIIEYLESRRSTGKKIEKYYTLKEKEKKKKGNLTEAEKRELEKLNKFTQSLKYGASLFAIEAHNRGETAEGLARIIKFNLQNGLGTNFTKKNKFIKLIKEHRDAVTLLLAGLTGLAIEKITRKHKDEVDLIPSYLAVVYKEAYAKAVAEGREAKDAAKEAQKAVEEVIREYNEKVIKEEKNKGLPKLEVDKKGMKRIAEEAEKLDKYQSTIEDLKSRDLIKKSEGLEKHFSNLATAWGMKAEASNTAADDFARIIALKQEFNIDLSKPFLIGIATEAIAKALAEGKTQEEANKIAADTVNKVIYEYNRNFVGEMMGGRAPPIINTLKKETGIKVEKFDLPFVKMDVEKIVEEANKTNKAEIQQLNPDKLKNIIELAGYNIIANAKDEGQPVCFSHLVMSGGAYLTQQKHKKEV